MRHLAGNVTKAQQILNGSEKTDWNCQSSLAELHPGTNTASQSQVQNKKMSRIFNADWCTKHKWKARLDIIHKRNSLMDAQQLSTMGSETPSEPNIIAGRERSQGAREDFGFDSSS